MASYYEEIPHCTILRLSYGFQVMVPKQVMTPKPIQIIIHTAFGG